MPAPKKQRVLLTPEQRLENKRATKRRYYWRNRDEILRREIERAQTDPAYRAHRNAMKTRWRAKRLAANSEPREKKRQADRDRLKDDVARRERANYLKRMRRKMDPEFRFREKLYRVRKAERLEAESNNTIRRQSAA